jgi:hypothetical protein
LPAEDNWNLVANPSVYLDTLPQPYRFINKCLDQMIMKPVFNQITLIEEKRKTPEYEGNVKEVNATGYMDLDGVTAIGRMNQVCCSGGTIEKQSATVQQKLVLGDKFGQIHLFDVSRKLVLDKMVLPKYEGRRIQHIATASLEWVDTTLTYLAVIARGTPIISIVVFKQNENKLYHFNSINMCPDLPNPEALEKNPD